MLPFPTKNLISCSVAIGRNITKVILFGFAQNSMHDPANEFKIRRLKKKRDAMSNCKQVLFDSSQIRSGIGTTNWFQSLLKKTHQ
jgi:hypothetical protein